MNPKELIEILENKLEQMPGNQELKEQLAFLLLSQGDLNRAETLFSDVIKTNPSAPDSIWGLAKLSWQKRSYDVAYSYMNLLASMPNASLNKEQALIFAKILAKKDHFIEASKWLDKAIAQDSSLLQSEMPFLKLIKHNLVLRNLDNTLGQTGSPMNGQMMDHLMPHNSNSPSSPIGRHVHYIVLEISQLLAPYQGLGYPNPMSAAGAFDDGTENIVFEEEPEKEDLNQTKKLITFDQIGGLKKLLFRSKTLNFALLTTNLLIPKFCFMVLLVAVKLICAELSQQKPK
jgi:tetratricopeptide (TPR) repeat protein